MGDTPPQALGGGVFGRGCCQGGPVEIRGRGKPLLRRRAVQDAPPVGRSAFREVISMFEK